MSVERFPNSKGAGQLNIGELSYYSQLSAFDLLERGIETERLEEIPVDRIVLEGSITDVKHIDNLAKSMSGLRGQISPLTVRARYVSEDRIHYDIIDGFHRAPALIAIEKKYARAVVLYGCDDEELFDLRVLAANSVKSVQFARVSQWMQNSFAQTEWAKRGLTLTQILSLVVMDTSGKRLGLFEGEATAAKNWVLSKAEKWNKPVVTIWENMRVVEAAAPDLVLNVRVGGGGRKSRRGELNPARLRAIVFPLQGEHNLQRKVAEVVVNENLVAEEAAVLAHAVAKVKDDPSRVEAVLENPYSLTRMPRGYGLSQNKKIRLDISEEMLNSSWWTENPQLTEEEKTSLYLVYDKRFGLELTAEKMGISEKMFFQIFQTANRKVIKRLKGIF